MNAFAGEPKWANTVHLRYSPFASRSLAVSQPNLIPHWQRFPRFGAVAASPSSSSSPGRLSGTDSSFGSFPHWQRFPRFGAVAAGPSSSSPVDRRLWYGFLIRIHSTLAAYPVIQCRCGKRSCLTAVIIAVVVTILMIAPCLLSSMRIYILCRHILSFCIVKHAVRAYCIYCQLFKFRQFAGPRAFCRKTAILSPVQQLLIFKVVGCQAFL